MRHQTKIKGEPNMSKNKNKRPNPKIYYDTKTYLITLIKRYSIIMAIALFISVIFCYVLSQEVEGFTPLIAVLATVAISLASILTGMIIFNRIDRKRESEQTPEKERDPFSD